MDNYTDKKFWIEYWESKTELLQPVPYRCYLSDVLQKINRLNKPKTALEIGGFPGFYTVYLSKYFHIQSSILDWVIHKPIIEKLSVINGLDVNNIESIEADLFSYSPQKKYDLVFSNGFIEHFEDTQKVIAKHVDFLEDNGTLFIAIPNFVSINGWFQKVFDPENYAIHNIKCMDIKLLKTVCNNLNLNNIKVSYYGYFSIWFHEGHHISIWAKTLRIMLFYPLKAFFKIFPFNLKYFAPFIIITAQKK
jgi:trans-aconitate methyltransferase